MTTTEPPSLHEELASQLANAKLQYEGTVGVPCGRGFCVAADPITWRAETLYTLKSQIKELGSEKKQLKENNDILTEQVSLLQRQNNDLAWQVRIGPQCPHVIAAKV